MVGNAGRRGATLLETLIGAALAAGGLALVAVASGELRGDAMSAMDAANLMTLGQASSMYQSDNNGWLVGSPGTSGRELLNDARADTSDPSLNVNGLATQPFDWASPLIPYIAPEFDIPDRRDERFALLNGTEIPDYDAPDFDPHDIDMTPSPGPLGVFADPAQDEASYPFDNLVLFNGIPGTAFQPQLASSYIASREFLWWMQAGAYRPRWAGPEFWGGPATLFPPNSLLETTRLPGASADAGHLPAHRPYLSRIGNPSQKVFLANGTRFQASFQQFIDHTVTATGTFGGAFADAGPWNTVFTRAWPKGLNAGGGDMPSVSFRRGGVGEQSTGHVLYFDNAVELLTMSDARRPERWLPRGTAVRLNLLDKSIQSDYVSGAIPDEPPLSLPPFTRIP